MLIPTASKTPNLYLPGLLPDGTPRTLVDIPGYWSRHSSDQHRGGPGEIYLDEVASAAKESLNRPWLGLVQLDRISKETGKVIQRTLTHNVECDLLINNMLKLLGSTGASSLLGQYLLIDTITAASQQTGGAINGASGAQTTIAVASGGAASLVAGNVSTSFLATASNVGTGQNVTTPGANPDVVWGTGIIWSYGTANAEYVSGTTSASTGTAINITSFTVLGGKTHSATEWVVAGPSTKDNPTALPAGGVFSTAIVATYNSGAGIKNRTAQLQFTYNTSTTPGSYTGIWVANASTWATGVAYAHVVSSPQVVNTSTSLQVTYTAQL